MVWAKGQTCQKITRFKSGNKFLILSRTKLISENNIKDNGSLTSSSALPLSSDSSISYNQSEPAHQNEQVDQFKGPEPIPFVVSKIPNFETVIENDSSSEKDEIIQAERVSVSSEEVISRKITIIEPEPEPKVTYFSIKNGIFGISKLEWKLLTARKKKFSKNIWPSEFLGRRTQDNLVLLEMP